MPSHVPIGNPTQVSDLDSCQINVGKMYMCQTDIRQIQACISEEVLRRDLTVLVGIQQVHHALQAIPRDIDVQSR